LGDFLAQAPQELIALASRQIRMRLEDAAEVRVL
jgi:hypothetical protein